MVRNGHAESLSGINVSSCVVVALGVFLLFLRRCDGAEEQQSDAKTTQQLHLYVKAATSHHFSVSMGARSVWLKQSSYSFFLTSSSSSSL